MIFLSLKKDHSLLWENCPGRIVCSLISACVLGTSSSTCNFKENFPSNKEAIESLECGWGEGFRESVLGWGLDPGRGNILDFRACSVITVYLTPLENPETTENPVMENTHMDEQYLAAEIDNCEFPPYWKIMHWKFSTEHPISSNTSEIVIE